MGDDATIRGVPKAPWSAVAPATAFTIDQFSTLLTETLERANSTKLREQALRSWELKYLHERKAVAGATALQGGLRPHRVISP